MQYFVSIGNRRLGGAIIIREQMFVEADSYDMAWRIAEGRCYNGEHIVDVELVKTNFN